MMLDLKITIDDIQIILAIILDIKNIEGNGIKKEVEDDFNAYFQRKFKNSSVIVKYSSLNRTFTYRLINGGVVDFMDMYEDKYGHKHYTCESFFRIPEVYELIKSKTIETARKKDYKDIIISNSLITVLALLRRPLFRPIKNEGEALSEVYDCIDDFLKECNCGIDKPSEYLSCDIECEGKIERGHHSYFYINGLKVSLGDGYSLYNFENLIFSNEFLRSVSWCCDCI